MSGDRLDVWMNWRQWDLFFSTRHAYAHCFIAIGPLYILVGK